MRGERRVAVRRKTVSGIMLSLLLIVMLILTFNIQSVESDWTWTETIYIEADGSVEPDTAPISTVDNITYTLTDNIVGHIPQYGFGVLINRANVVLDGAAYTLRSTLREDFSSGVFWYVANVTVQNVKIENFDSGILLYDYHHYSMISGNTLTNNRVGIRLFQSSDIVVCRNQPTINYIGIALDSIEDLKPTYRNTVFENTILGNDWGIYLLRALNNTFYHNNFINNTGQASDSAPSNNDWHHPTLLEGNYWSDYAGVDDGSGVGKHAIAGDGIGDTLIPHPGTDYDFYPLMETWTPSQSTPVGGIWIPVNKLELLAPYIGLTVLLAVAVVTVVYVKKRKRQTEIFS